MGIKFKQIDNLQNTFDSVSGNLQQEITSNSDAVYGIASGEYTFEGDKHFSNNVNFSGAQGILVNSDNIYTPNSIFADSVKIGYPLSDPRNSTPLPLGALQVSGGQIYLEDQLNIRNNSSINIENGTITSPSGNFYFVTGTTGSFDSLTGNNLNFSTLNPTLIDFNLTSAPAHREGRLFYDSDNSTLTLYNEESEVSLQVGQEQYVRVRNNTTADITNGSVVRVNGAQGNNATVSLASADSEVNAQVIGLATHTILQNSFGYVTTYGIVNGLNTNSYNAGDEIHLSDNSGEFTTGIINSPNYRVSVGHVLRSHQNQGRVLVQVGQPKLGGGDVKSLSTVNVSGINYYESAADSAGILGSSDSFVYNDAKGFIGLGTGDPNGILDINSTVSAPIMPRMTTAQMNAIPNPVEGMIIYNTESGKFAGRESGGWATISSIQSSLTSSEITRLQDFLSFWSVQGDGSLLPTGNNTQDIGSASLKIRDIFEDIN